MKTSSLAALLLLASHTAAANAQVETRGAQAVVLPAVKNVTFLGRGAVPLAKSGAVFTATGGQESVIRVELVSPAVCVERCVGVTLDGQRSGYMPVSVSGNNPAQFNVQRVLVTTGQTVGEVKFVTIPVTASTSVVVSAFSAGSAPQQATLVILAPVMTGFAVDKTNVIAGEVVHGSVSFSGPPASATAVKFAVQTTNSQVLKPPASVTLAAGTTVATFDIAAQGVAQDQTAQLVATYLDKNLPAEVSVRAAVLGGVVRVSPCCDNPFRISITGRPPPQGAVVELTSANPARMVVPKTVTILPDATTIDVTGQSIPGPSDDHIPITIAYHGVSKHYAVLSRKFVKPDLNFSTVTLTDRFGNAITAPADGQSFKLCATVAWQREGEFSPNVPVPPSVLRISYRSPTGIGTSTGRDVDFPIAFVPTASFGAPPITSCVELPGLAPGGYYEATLTVDFKHEVDEDRESNNTRELKIVRPPTE